MPERIIQWQQYNQTILHPCTVVLVLLAGVLIFMLPRRLVPIPILTASLFVTEVQRVVIAGLDFNVMRIMAILAWMRVVLRGETRRFTLTPLDKALIVWTVSDTLFYTLLMGTSQAFVNRLGHALNGLGLYLVLRFLIRSFDDVRRMVKILVALSIPVMAAMVIEHIWGRNIFSVFGGVPEYTVVRAGRLRAQAAFMHPILAGTFGASLIPLCVLLWYRGGSRPIASAGLLAGTVIAFASASSGPVLGYLSAFAALAAWPLRRRMRLVRWTIGLTLLGLHLVMKAPVWALINRVAVVGGSTAYHRYKLIDEFIRHFSDWWLCGSTKAGTWGWGLQDITNHYVLQGLNGGLLTLICFIAVVVAGFRCVGRSLRLCRGMYPEERMAWCLGCALFVHAVSFFGVSYFDQIILVWYLLLALIATFYLEAQKRAAEAQAAAAEEELLFVPA